MIWGNQVCSTSHISLPFPYSNEFWCKENKDLSQVVAEVNEKFIIK